MNKKKQRKDVIEYLNDFYGRKESEIVITSHRRKKWRERAEEMLTVPDLIQPFPIEINIFHLLLERLGNGSNVKQRRRSILGKKEFSHSELKRLESIEEGVEESYSPHDRELLVKLILLLGIPLSLLRNHVDWKMKKAGQAGMWNSMSTNSLGAGVADSHSYDLTAVDYPDALSRHFWDKVAEEVKKSGRYELLD